MGKVLQQCFVEKLLADSHNRNAELFLMEFKQTSFHLLSSKGIIDFDAHWGIGLKVSLSPLQHNNQMLFRYW